MGKGRTPSVTHSCLKCGKEYHPWKRTDPQGFCSRSCAPRGRTPTIASIPCKVCGVIFKPTKTGRTYCSRECYRVDPDFRRIDAAGYVLVYRPEHPAAYASGQVLEHRVVMEEFLDRTLERHETIHHINGVHDDNRIENLQLRSGRHGKGVVHQCGDCGSSNIIQVPISEPPMG